MSFNKFEYRLAKQDSFCRVCDKVNKRNKDMVVYIRSIRNRGQNILICKDCIDKIYNAVKEDN